MVRCVTFAKQSLSPSTHQQAVHPGGTVSSRSHFLSLAGSGSCCVTREVSRLALRRGKVFFFSADMGSFTWLAIMRSRFVRKYFKWLSICQSGFSLLLSDPMVPGWRESSSNFVQDSVVFEGRSFVMLHIMSSYNLFFLFLQIPRAAVGKVEKRSTNWTGL